MSGHDGLKFWSLLAALTGAALYSFIYCFRTWRKNRVIEDTPTSRVRSAAQGYAEFTGRGLMLPNTDIQAPLSGIPCTWWRYEIEERRSGGRSRRWTTIRRDTSATPFILDDGTGQCLIDPRGAEVFPGANDVWYGDSEWPDGRVPHDRGVSGWLANAFAGGKYRYSEHRLQPHEPVYAVGSFRTLGGVSAENPERALLELLREWKHDQHALLARFDDDHDGILSADEWERARTAAREQVIAQRCAAQPDSGMNVLSKPTDGRAFLVAGCDAQTLGRRLRRRAALAVAAFVASSCALAWMLARL